MEGVLLALGKIFIIFCKYYIARLAKKAQNFLVRKISSHKMTKNQNVSESEATFPDVAVNRDNWK